MSNEMQWSTHSSVLTNNKLNMEFQRAAQPASRFRQFCKFKTAFGKESGQTENWLKVSNLGAYGGQLTETNTIFEATQPLTWGTVTVNEYGLSIPFTFRIEALSEFDVRAIMRESLLDDCVKVIDGIVEQEFNKTYLRYCGTSATGGSLTTGSQTVHASTNTSALNGYHIRTMVAELKKRNVPGWSKAEGDYACILSVDADKSMKDALSTTNQYTETGYQKILNGEIGRFEGVRFTVDNFATLYTYSASARTATTKSTYWDASGLSGEAYVFGSPTVREIVVVPEEVRVKIPTDFGRSQGIAWYMIAGWKIEWDTNDATDARIVKWDSAS